MIYENNLSLKQDIILFSREKQLKNNAKLAKTIPKDDPVINDFHREMLFHQQAQAAVIDGISKLKKLGIYTKR